MASVIRCFRGIGQLDNAVRARSRQDNASKQEFSTLGLPLPKQVAAAQQDAMDFFNDVSRHASTIV
jgi:hypothetical protein